MDNRETVNLSDTEQKQPGLDSKHRRGSREKRKKAIELIKAGISMRDISHKLKVDILTVNQWAKIDLATETSSSGLPLHLLYGEEAEKRNKVIELFKQGKSATEIAGELDVERTAVIRWVKKERASDKSLPDFPNSHRIERRIKAIELFKVGTPIREICHEINRNRTVVADWIKKEQAIDTSLPDFPAQSMAEKRTRAIELFKNGKPTLEISRQLNVTRRTVNIWVRKALTGDASSSEQSLRVLYGKLGDRRKKVNRDAVSHWLKKGTPSETSLLSSRKISLISKRSNKLEEEKENVRAAKITSKAFRPRESSPSSSAMVLSKEQKKKKALELYEKGILRVHIARALGVHHSTVTRWFNRIGGVSLSSTTSLSKEQYTVKKRKAFELNEKGMSKAEAAEAQEVKSAVVARWLSGASWSGQSSPSSTTLVSRDENVEKEKKVIKVFDPVMHQAKMARSLGISLATLKKWLVAADSSRENCSFIPGKWVQVDQV